MVTTGHVLEALRTVHDPDLQKDLVSLGFIKNLQISGGRVAFAIELTTPACPVRDVMKEDARAAVAKLPGVTDVDITMTSQIRQSVSRGAAHRLVPTIKNIIPIASGKGGVGKSTVSVNLALALAKSGARVGLMDADVYGPTIPTLLGITEGPEIDEHNRMTPVEQYGLKVISMGFFMKPEEAVVWRGPMLHKTVEQFLGGVKWGELDYLIIDLPPGCLTADTLVSTTRGPIPIKDVQESDYVYSFDGHLNKARSRSPLELHAGLVKRKVTAVLPQGQAPVVELKTPTRTIRGTADHPILTLTRSKRPGSRYYQHALAWKKLGRLKPRDIIVVAKKLPQEAGRALRLPALRSPAKIPVHIAQHSTAPLARLVGYFLGDGTVRTMTNGHYWGVWFSEPRAGAYREKYIQLAEELFALERLHEQPLKFAVLSNRVAELFDKLGLHKPALGKTVPSWVFSLPEDQKVALIEGFCDADGHRRKPMNGHRRSGWMCFESPNQELMQGVRALCMDVGFKVGNLAKRTRQTRLPSTGRLATSTFYGFEANRTAKTDRYGAGMIRGAAIGKGLRHEYLGFERVRAVRAAGMAEVYDLQVEGQHNFVANGLVVHNTGDVQLSLCQLIPITGAVIVSTPQDVALNVAQKAVAMFKKLNAPMLGMIENMSYYVCPHCSKPDDIFGNGGAEAIAQQLGLPFLGKIPLARVVRESSDDGHPIVMTAPESPAGRAFVEAAEKLAAQASIRGMQAELSPAVKVTF